MATVINQVRRKLTQEEHTVSSRSKEITVDFPAIRAEIRAEAFREVLQILEVKDDLHPR